MRVSRFGAFFRLGAALALFVLLTACSMHPLGMGDEEWQQLSPKQRLQALENQLEFDRLAEQRRSGICVRELGTFSDYRRGIRRTVVADEFLRGQLRCSLVPGVAGRR